MSNVPFNNYHFIVSNWFKKTHPEYKLSRNTRDKIIKMSYKKHITLEEGCEIYAKYLKI